jgi:hypothetical protein
MLPNSRIDSVLCISKNEDPSQYLTMSERSNLESSSKTAKITRGHSCLPCHQRKVKCDGNRPCATCVKGGKECRPIVHAKAIRQRDPRAGQIDLLLTRLRRCEALLQSHGISVESQKPSEASVVNTPADDGQLILQDGHARYIESSLWKGLESEVFGLIILSYQF